MKKRSPRVGLWFGGNDNTGCGTMLCPHDNITQTLSLKLINKKYEDETASSADATRCLHCSHVRDSMRSIRESSGTRSTRSGLWHPAMICSAIEPNAKRAKPLRPRVAKTTKSIASRSVNARISATGLKPKTTCVDTVAPACSSSATCSETSFAKALFFARALSTECRCSRFPGRSTCNNVTCEP